MPRVFRFPLSGADGASATALQPPPHLLTTLPATGRGGGRRVRHGTAAMAAGGGGAEPVPLEGDLGERLGRSPRTSVPVALAVAAERSAGRR